MRKTKTMPTADQPVAPAPEPVKTAPARVKPLDPAELQLAEHSFRTWHFDLATLRSTDGKPVTLNDFMQPAFWGRNADQIGVDDRIRVIAADRSFDFEFRVRSKAPGLGLLLEPAFGSMPGSPAYQYFVQISQAVRAETDAQRAATNRQHGIAS